MDARIAVIQMNPTPDRDRNFYRAADLLSRAREAGARIAVLPEMFSAMVPAWRWRGICEAAGGPVERFLSERARENDLVVVGGSYIEDDNGSLYNTCPVFDPEGALVGRYRKMHLFWTDIEDGVRYDERTWLSAGNERLVFEAAGFRLAVGICYDLRFPEFFRRPRGKPADVYCLPAAFMEATGRAHWHPLVRARAVENLAYFAASGTVGEHYPVNDASGELLKTYGHSIIVSPWGEVIQEIESGEGLAVAELRRDVIDRSRRRLRALDHVREDLWRGE